MAINPYGWPSIVTTISPSGNIVYTDTGATPPLFNIMLTTTAISLGIRLDELKDFNIEITKQGVTAMTGYEKMYKGIVQAAMIVIEKRGD
jgi:Tfp pilus assembly pilus retraction ATPase PilT